MTNPRCPLGYYHRDTQLVEWRVALVCVFSPRDVGWSQGCGGIHFLLCTSFELGGRHPIREEVLGAGRSKAGGSVILEIDDDDQRGSLVKDLCTGQRLLPLFLRDWTLAWLPPAGGTRKKKVDFFFTNQLIARAITNRSA